MADKLKLFVRVRVYEGDAGWANVWLLRQEGAGTECLLHGRVKEKKAELLAEFFRGLGVKVETEQSPLEDVAPKTKTRKGLLDE